MRPGSLAIAVFFLVVSMTLSGCSPMKDFKTIGELPIAVVDLRGLCDNSTVTIQNVRISVEVPYSADYTRKYSFTCPIENISVKQCTDRQGGVEMSLLRWDCSQRLFGEPSWCYWPQAQECVIMVNTPEEERSWRETISRCRYPSLSK